jgi:hypothetical protein
MSSILPVTLNAWAFSLMNRDNALRGFGLVAPETRYASVIWLGYTGIERRHATPAQWKEIEHEFSVGLPPRPLDPSTALAGLLCADSGLRVEWLHATPVNVERPEDVAKALDLRLAELRQTVAAGG